MEGTVNIQIGTAPDSWGVWFPSDPKQTPPWRFLDEVVEAGYSWIELGPYGYLPKDLGTLGTELARRGLKVTGTFIMGELESAEGRRRLENEAEAIGALLQALGARYLVLIDDTYTDLFTGRQLAPRRLEGDAWKHLVESANLLGRKARECYRLQLAFHPHAETHVEYEDQIEAFLEETDPNFVGLCLDTGHHAYRGGDAVQFVRDHHKRIPYLHLKNVNPDLQRKVERDQIPFAIAVGMDMFCEPSSGAVDFPALLEALRAVAYDGWAIVEQDMYPAPPEKPLPIARRTRAYLTEIGFG
jgi:inosose dehydratase